MPLSNLTAYTGIPENSAATPGLFDSRFNTVHANILAVDASVSLVSSMVSGGSGISGYRDVTLARFGGATGDGTTDDRGAFNTGGLSTATQAVFYLPSSASVYRLATSVSVAGQFSPIPGALVRPSSGATLTVGTVDAGPFQWFDSSLSGGVSFTKQRLFLGEWFGLGQGGDDAAILASIGAMLPTGSKVLFNQTLAMTFKSTWTFNDHADVEFVARPPARSGLGVSIAWQGPYLGTMVAWNHTDHCRIKNISFKPNAGATVMLGASVTSGSSVVTINGYQPLDSGCVGKFFALAGGSAGNSDLTGTVFSFQSAGQITVSKNASNSTGPARLNIGSTTTSGPALVCIDSDMTGDGHTTTGCEFSENEFSNIGYVPGQVCIRVAKLSGSNCEYFSILRNNVDGAFSKSLFDPIENGVSISMTSGTSLVVCNAAFITTSLIGARFQIPGAGASSGTSALDTCIVSLVGPSPTTQMLVRDLCRSNVTGVRALIASPDGVGFQFDHSNSMKHVVDDNLFNFVDTGIWQKNGAMEPRGNSFSGCNTDIRIDAASNPVVMLYNNSEQAGQHLVTGTSGSISPIAMIGHRLGNVNVKPNSPYIQFDGGCDFLAEGTQFDNSVRTDNTIWGLNAGGRYTIRNTRYAGAPQPTLEQAGYGSTLGQDAFLVSENEDFFTGMGQYCFSRMGSVAAANKYVATGSLNGYTNLSAPNATPNDSYITNAQVSLYETSTGGLGFRQRNHSGVLSTKVLAYPQAFVVLSDAAHVATDASLGNAFYVNLAATNRTMDAPTNPVDGQRITYYVQNSSGGAIATVWANGFSTYTGGGLGAGWTDPANARIRSISYTYYAAFGTWIQDGTVSGDIAW